MPTVSTRKRSRAGRWRDAYLAVYAGMVKAANRLYQRDGAALAARLHNVVAEQVVRAARALARRGAWSFPQVRSRLEAFRS